MRETLNEVKRNQSGTLKQLDDLNKKVGTMNKELQKTVKEAVRKEVDSQLSAKLVLMEKKLENKIENKIVDIKENMQSAELMSKEEIKDVVKKAYKEERQREIRKANMMLFNVPETKSRDPKVIKKHNMESVLRVLRVLEDMEDIEDKV